MLTSVCRLTLLWTLPAAVRAADTRHMEKGLLGKLLQEELSYPLRPPGLHPNSNTPTILSNGPVSISVSAIIKDVLLDPTGDSLKCSVEIVETWIDLRLGFDSFRGQVNSLTVVEASEGVGRIWQTETSVVSGETQNAILARIRLYPSGHVDRLLRFDGVTLPCFTDIAFTYPYGAVKCNLRIGSLAHIAEEVEYRWNSTYAVSLAGPLRPSGIHLHKITAKSAPMTMPGGIHHSSIEAWLIIYRSTCDLLLRTVLPCSLCVVFACSALMPALSAHATPITGMALVLLASTVCAWPTAPTAANIASLLAVISCVYIVAIYLVSLSTLVAHQGSPEGVHSKPVAGVDAVTGRAIEDQHPLKDLLTSIVLNSRSPSHELILRVFLPVTYLLFVFTYTLAVIRII